MGGGAHRGPVALARQRRTIRCVQVLLVLFAGALLVLAGYSWGRVAGYDAGRRAAPLDVPPAESTARTIVLGMVGLAAVAGAVALQGRGGVRIPTPARLEDLAGRAEATVAERSRREGSEPDPTSESPAARRPNRHGPAGDVPGRG